MMTKGRILSVHEDTNANATLMGDGDVIFAAAEERFTRRKFQGGFPRLAVESALNFAGCRLMDVESFVAANRFHFLSRLPGGFLPEEEHDFFSPVQKGYLYYHHILLNAAMLGKLVEEANRLLLLPRFSRFVPLADHHTAHAYSAYFSSGFDEALAVSIDNMGDGSSAKVFRCRGGRCKFMWGSSAIHSPGQFYGAITQLLGFHCLLAGKTTGLAAYGDPSKAYPVMEKLFGLSKDGKSFYLYPLIKSRRTGKYYGELMERFSLADVAAAAQKRIEDVVCGYVSEALKELGASDVVLAGGVFGNVKLNQKIFEIEGVRRIFVHPAMSDQGISLGAAYWRIADGGLGPSRLKHVFWGPGFHDEEIGRALDRAGLRYSEERDIEARVADLLCEGRVVARFKGKMEYGPRALGNRSILCRPDDPSVNTLLNRKLGRTEFMPFAPSILSDFAEACLENLAGAEDAARFMTITFRCTDRFRKSCPAVVHVDGTARPQIVREEDTPDYYRLIKLFQERTSLPCVINTSFNMHEEPIVCTPDDAIRAFLEAGLDCLAIGRFLAPKPDR